MSHRFVRSIPYFCSLATVGLLAAPIGAAQRPFGPVPQSQDIKTAAEPLVSTPARVPAASTTPAAPRAPKPDANASPQTRAMPRPAGMHYDLPGDGALWVRGDDYKMSFGADGATYYPRFGARQPHNVPLVLTPELVTSSGAAVAFDATRAAVRAGNRVEIDRGAFVEAYDLTPESIEQTFLFRALPSRGDLVLRIPGTTDLEGRAAASGLEFRNELGRVEYGQAVAIDASGRRVDAATQHVDGAIELRVDAEFLSTATLPLLIDPVVQTFVIDITPFDNFSADVAWYDNFFCWFVVYEEIFSATDHDVYARIMNVDGTTRHEGYVDQTAVNWSRPRCGSLNAAGQFLVAANTNTGGLPQVGGREVGALDLAMFAQIIISNPADGPATNPVVGGDPFTLLPSAYAVAYEREFTPTDFDILVRRVNPDNTLDPAGPIFLSNSGSTIDLAPAISKSNDSLEWMITWHRLPLSGGNTDVMGGRVDFQGIITQLPFQVTTSTLPEALSAVSSPLTSTRRHLVAYQRVFSTGDSDIQLTLVDGASIVDTLDLSVLEGSPAGTDHIEVSVDSDGEHFAVAYAEEFAGADYDIYVSEIGVVNNELVLMQARQNLAFSGAAEHRPAIASYRSSGGLNQFLTRRYVAAWDDDATGGDIEGGSFDGQEGGGLTPFCFGDGSGTACPCGNSGANAHGCANSVNSQGALLSATGIASTATDTVVLQGSGMPNASCLYFQGTQGTGTVFGDGLRCAGGTTVRLATKTNVNGSSQFPAAGDPSVHVRGQVPAGGGTRTYQAWYRNAASFCTSAAFNLSNGVTINWLP
jgi:hypothetical protein